MNDGTRISKKRIFLRDAGSSGFGFRSSFGIRISAFSISNQFLHRLTAGIDQILRAARQVGDRRLAHVDAEIVIERREHIAKEHGAFSWFAAPAVRYADDLAGPDAAAGQ